MMVRKALTTHLTQQKDYKIYLTHPTQVMLASVSGNLALSVPGAGGQSVGTGCGFTDQTPKPRTSTAEVYLSHQ